MLGAVNSDFYTVILMNFKLLRTSALDSDQQYYSSAVSRVAEGTDKWKLLVKIKLDLRIPQDVEIS
jgi:hypothetical protein